MMGRFQQAITAGVERLTAWADLLDRINVFPVADGDTGRNLVISLAPLRRLDFDRKVTAGNLLLSARGNSGNIASAFFQRFIASTSIEHIPNAIRQGRDHAWQAVPDPHPGTMLTFFDALVAAVPDSKRLLISKGIERVLSHLEAAVHCTTHQQPKLERARVVDAGALGMFLYFEGFFHELTENRIHFCSVTETFRDKLQVLPSYSDEMKHGYCVDTVIRSQADATEARMMIAPIGESIIVTGTDDCLKVHFHTRDTEEARRNLGKIGKIIGWTEDDLFHQTSAFGSACREPAMHIMTDAAASLTRQDANDWGISLLDSYITIGDRCMPETYLHPHELYDAMRLGIKVATAQASIFERHQIYASVLSRHSRVLYLCVGSAFTGNYRVAMHWKHEHDHENRLEIIDTGAASGRLAVLALAVAAYSCENEEIEKIMAFAKNAIAQCEEYVFLDCLEYLAAGGRLSKTGAFLGDMLHMKPIVSPMNDGARKVGVVRNRKEQLHFALDVLQRSLLPEQKAVIMLEYSDNRAWIEEIKSTIEKMYPEARIIVHPLSLTSGVHMGPATWAVAFMPIITTSSKQ